MVIVLAFYALIIWLLFFKLKLFPWGGVSKTIVSLVGLAIVLTVLGLLNTRTPSGRVAIMAPVVEIAPVVGGTVAEVPVISNTLVEAGQTLLQLDPRPYEFALQLAQANFDIAEKTYERRSTAYQANRATVSEQSVDESLSQLQAAEARLRLAEYELEQTTLIAPSAGEITGIRVNTGDQVTAMSGVMPLIRSDKIFIAGVFQQNGSSIIQPGAEVAVTFEQLPGRIYWTTIRERTKGSSGGQIVVDSTLLDGSDVGSSSELLAVVEWPGDLAKDSLDPGAVGSATVIGADAGPIGSLAKVLLWVKSYTSYL